eukprot:15928198-Heterocapsa_arctica.AAC.1
MRASPATPSSRRTACEACAAMSRQKVQVWHSYLGRVVRMRRLRPAMARRDRGGRTAGSSTPSMARLGRQRWTTWHRHSARQM